MPKAVENFNERDFLGFHPERLFFFWLRKRFEKKSKSKISEKISFLRFINSVGLMNDSF